MEEEKEGTEGIKVGSKIVKQNGRHEKNWRYKISEGKNREGKLKKGERTDRTRRVGRRQEQKEEGKLSKRRKRSTIRNTEGWKEKAKRRWHREKRKKL